MRDNETSYQAARRYQAEHPGVSYTRAKRITAAPRAPRMVVFNPTALRAGADRLMSLAAQLRSDPASRDSVVTGLVTQLRELASDRVSKTEIALAERADAFEVGTDVTAESIEKLAGRLNALAGAVSATDALFVRRLNEVGAELDLLFAE